jgi:hypothetical protein
VARGTAAAAISSPAVFVVGDVVGSLPASDLTAGGLELTARLAKP